MEKKAAEIVSVNHNRIIININDLEKFKGNENSVKIGSYIKVIDAEYNSIIAMIEGFSIDETDDESEKYVAEATPIGTLKDNVFSRGGGELALPAKDVLIADIDEIKQIYEFSVEDNKKFCFSTLASADAITVPVDGNRFFNKHTAIVGSTGSGKSHTVAKLLQDAVKPNNGSNKNNAHIIIFDIHGEYKAAFPDAQLYDVENLKLPYWLMTGEELKEFMVESSDSAINIQNTFREVVVNCKRKAINEPAEANRVTFDTPVFFGMNDVITELDYLDNEMVEGAKGQKAGPLNGKLTHLVSRLKGKMRDRRLTFLLGDEAEGTSFEDTLRMIMGYGEHESNITIFDLSGVPFEVLSITVSMISRFAFEYGYYSKRYRELNQTGKNAVPVLLVYEEAHKYVPQSGGSKYNSSKVSIERIAKEGRKYGVSLMLSSQRPSEISETIFSQCNNFLALRLTNPADQNYIRRLLPDSLGGLVDSLPTLKAGECLLTGDAVIVPSIVKIEMCERPPASSDIDFWQLWKQEWQEIDFSEVEELWKNI